MRSFTAVCIAFIALSACNKAIQTSSGAVILPGSMVEQVLHQCSRSAPEKGEATWQPNAGDIAIMEDRIAAELPKQVEFREVQPKLSFPQAFARQYVGIVRHGRKFIYGNFVPKSGFEREDAMKPIVFCDGGPAFFGVEFDPTSKQFTAWGFNGLA